MRYLDMPKDPKLLNEITQAINGNKVDDVKHIFQSRMKKKQKDRPSAFVLGCVPERDEKLTREFEQAALAAATLCDTTILQYLLQQGLNVNFLAETMPNGEHKSQNSKKASPLHVATKKKLHETIALLLEANADVNKKDHNGQTPLHVAVQNADCQATRMLLFRGAKVQVTDKTGASPLQTAARYGHVELVRILLEHDAQVFNPDQKGPSPLHISAMEGHIPLIDIFSHYADINIKVSCSPDGKQKAPLHLAAERGMVETVRFLVERFCADVHILDSDKQSSLHSTMSKRHDYKCMRRKEDFEATVDLLLRKGVSVSLQNVEGDTGLHLAARNQYHKIAEMLLVASANPQVKNKRGQTPKDDIPDYDLPMKQIFRNCAAYSSPYIMRLRQPPPLEEESSDIRKEIRSPCTTRVIPLSNKEPHVINKGKKGEDKQAEKDTVEKINHPNSANFN